MRRLSLVFLLLLILLVAAVAQAKPQPAKADPPLQMMTYQMVLFRDAPPHEPPAGAKLSGEDKLIGHLANLARLNRERIAVIYGPFNGDDPGAVSMKGLVGLAILDVPDADAARKQFASDPYIQAGDTVLEVKPWLGPKGWFKPPAQPAASDPNKVDVEPFIFGVLVRGPAAKSKEPVHTQAQREEIQKGHLAYMAELNKQGKLLAAGPFMEDGDWRGIVVYRVATVADAQALAAGDPAVKAGRLALEARPWMTLRGILP